MTARAEPKKTFSPARLRPLIPLWAHGLEGPWLCRRLAGELAGLAAAQPALIPLRTALSTWRFERHPLDPAATLAFLTEPRRAVDPGQRALARRLAPRLTPPAEAGQWPTLRDGADRKVALAALDRGLADPSRDLFWRGKALEYALGANLPDLARRVVAPLADEPGFAPLAARLAAEVAAAFDGPEAALTAARDVDRRLFPRFAALARANALADGGDRAGAAAELGRLWRREPWHPGLTLRLHELRFPVSPAPVASLPGRTFVWLYTWNRARALRETLARLAQSRLGPATVTVLDNGATDDTMAVCAAMAGRFAPGQFRTVRLPVNIGAPAARNWLAATAGLGDDDLAAYLDDDALVPPDWLEVLAGALRADPGAEAAGPRILAGDSAVTLSADVRLLPPDASGTVRPLRNCPQGPDLGMLAASRPCPSVSGCCHLFRGRALRHPAPFDIRFSPSQFDDLARDLTAFLAGRRCVLAGDAAVAHHQPPPGPGSANRALGARVKLDGLFPAEVMAAAAARDLALAWDELEEKWARLAEHEPARAPGT